MVCKSPIRIREILMIMLGCLLCSCTSTKTSLCHTQHRIQDATDENGMMNCLEILSVANPGIDIEWFGGSSWVFVWPDDSASSSGSAALLIPVVDKDCTTTLSRSVLVRCREELIAVLSLLGGCDAIVPLETNHEYELPVGYIIHSRIPSFPLGQSCGLPERIVPASNALRIPVFAESDAVSLVITWKDMSVFSGVPAPLSSLLFLGVLERE